MSQRLGTVRPPTRPRHAAKVLAASAVVVSAALVVLLVVWNGTSDAPPAPPSPEKSLALARRALSDGDFATAEHVAAAALEGDQRPDPELALLAGEAATKRSRWDDALAYYALIPDDGSDAGVEALLAAGEILRHRGEAGAALVKFRAAVARWPEHPLPNNRLALLLSVTGRRWESAPYLLELIRLDAFDVKVLCMLGQIDATVELPKEFQRPDPMTSDDPHLPLATAIAKVEANDLDAARRLLERALELDPNLVEAHARLGRVLSQAGLTAEFDRWHAELPEGAFDHPGTWHALGLESLRRGRKEQAARCFWESTRLAPEYQPANYQLGLALKSLGRQDAAADFLDRAGWQQELAASVGILYKAPERTAEMRRAAQSTAKLGRYWESWAWCRLASFQDPAATWARDLGQSLEGRLATDLPQTDPAGLPVADLSEYPLPVAGATASETARGASTEGAVAFAEEAARVGIDFTFSKGTPPEQPSKRMHEFTGGGVAAIDFDADGRPDLFFTQGCRFPSDPEGPTDRLFRNLGDRFIDATGPSATIEPVAAFGQGVAFGDYDGDGFADLYVGNVGRNRLLRNNGDGTFTDATDEAGIPDSPLTEAWTTSVLMADVSGDGLPDLFDANYVTGDEVYDLVCKDANGNDRACDPNVFAACPDRLLASGGDGTFSDVTADAGVTAPDGNGLGVVAADFDGSGRLSLFVANDQKPNHFYANVSDPGGLVRFEERGLVSGLAVDRDGRPQACMGVAVDDADGDGRFDLFITNFYLESNTLYHQLPGGGFEDATIEFDLRDAGYELLGFGTQFLDADLDGRPDLVVTNGHVDDYRARGIPYRMRPQFYRNVGGRFEEVAADRLGPFFAGEYLGRGLATLDWDGDGREDFAISHLDSPAALLTNRSEAGNALGVRLIATRSARDAIGAVVTVESAAGTRVRQLTAGDGYQAANERRLAFGLGGAESAELAVRWPSGQTETFGRLAAGADWLLVEGRGAPLRLSVHRPRGKSSGQRTAEAPLQDSPRHTSVTRRAG